MSHQAPARGVMEGIRQDLQKSKEGSGYNPNGIGNAYSHNFLNQKPWHPANFRNQAKVFEAQQKKQEETKKKEVAKAEFQAEQEFLQSLSYLSPEEQQKFKERQGVQFLYMKPPGADSLPAGPPSKAGDEQAEAGPSAPAVENLGPQTLSQRQDKRSHVGNMLGAMRALQNHEKWEVRHVGGVGRSPPRGQNSDTQAANQQFLISDSEEELQEGDRKRRREDPDSKLAQAKAVLQRAGIDLKALKAPKSRKKRKKEKRDRREKSRKRDDSS